MIFLKKFIQLFNLRSLFERYPVFSLFAGLFGTLFLIVVIIVIVPHSHSYVAIFLCLLKREFLKEPTFVLFMISVLLSFVVLFGAKMSNNIMVYYNTPVFFNLMFTLLCTIFCVYNAFGVLSHCDDFYDGVSNQIRTSVNRLEGEIKAQDNLQGSRFGIDATLQNYFKQSVALTRSVLNENELEGAYAMSQILKHNYAQVHNGEIGALGRDGLPRFTEVTPRNVLFDTNAGTMETHRDNPRVFKEAARVLSENWKNYSSEPRERRPLSYYIGIFNSTSTAQDRAVEYRPDTDWEYVKKHVPQFSDKVSFCGLVVATAYIVIPAIVWVGRIIVRGGFDSW